ncbi:MAG: DUF302 domain-containing protein [Cocleimonas sp.]
MSYTLTASLNQPIDEAIETLKSTLMTHKLGIVSEVNVQATIKNKLDEDIAPYRILGACNPGMAKKIIEAAPEAGALLPCTIVVREEDGKTIFHFMAPEPVLGLEKNAVVQEVAKLATTHIQAVIDDLKMI